MYVSTKYSNLKSAFFIPHHGTSCSTMELSTSTDTSDQQKGESDHVSKKVTLNIENFHTNKLYLKELMDTYEIICLQEHWLYNFEQST